MVKLGGHALESLLPDSAVLVDLAHDIGLLRDEGIHVVVVHGGGPQIAHALDQMGLESTFEDGLRITSRDTMTVVVMALSEVNVRIVAALNNAGLASVGLSGADAQLLRSESVGPPWNRVGHPPLVARAVLDALWTSGLTPVVNPIAIDEGGDILNCNADTTAGVIAGSLGAEALVLLSDIDQIRADPDDASSALALVSSEEVRELMRTGAARDGMRPKATAALNAIRGGAQRIILANGTRGHALRDALAQSIPTTEVVQ